MKNLLILYLLMLSPHLIAQNSALVFNDKAFSNSGSGLLDTYKISVDNLSLIDQNLQRKAKNLLLATNLIPLDSFDSDNFSSLILKEQLEDLDHSTPFKVLHNATLERFIRVYLRDRKA